LSGFPSLLLGLAKNGRNRQCSREICSQKQNGVKREMQRSKLAFEEKNLANLNFLLI
jgi:hypothetical protein